MSIFYENKTNTHMHELACFSTMHMINYESHWIMNEHISIYNNWVISLFSGIIIFYPIYKELQVGRLRCPFIAHGVVAMTGAACSLQYRATMQSHHVIFEMYERRWSKHKQAFADPSLPLDVYVQYHPSLPHVCDFWGCGECLSDSLWSVFGRSWDHHHSCWKPVSKIPNQGQKDWRVKCDVSDSMRLQGVCWSYSALFDFVITRRGLQTISKNSFAVFVCFSCSCCACGCSCNSDGSRRIISEQG